MFEKIADGKYAVEFVSARSGKTQRILVKKTSVPNPSVRGGAYREQWVAYNGGLYLKETGDTRQAAYDKAVARLTNQGLL